MHIADGVVSAPVWAGSLGGAVGIGVAVLRTVESRRVPKIAVMTSAFFVASLIHVPLGPTSVHLMVSGLVGLILGPAAFIAIGAGLALQAVLFQHGGVTTIGVNTLIMGAPAVFVWWLCCCKFPQVLCRRPFLLGAFAGAVSSCLSVFCLALALTAAGSVFVRIAQYAVLAHVPVVAIEALVAGSAVTFICRVKPGLLAAGRRNDSLRAQEEGHWG